MIFYVRLEYVCGVSNVVLYAFLKKVFVLCICVSVSNAPPPSFLLASLCASTVCVLCVYMLVLCSAGRKRQRKNVKRCVLSSFSLYCDSFYPLCLVPVADECVGCYVWCGRMRACIQPYRHEHS